MFNKIQPKNLRQTVQKNLSHSIEQIEHSKLNKIAKNKIIATKTGMLIACLAVPALEYALSFAKNLLTLKVFKISDFNNVANLNKKGNNTEENVWSGADAYACNASAVGDSSGMAGIGCAGSIFDNSLKVIYK